MGVPSCDKPNACGEYVEKPRYFWRLYPESGSSADSERRKIGTRRHGDFGRLIEASPASRRQTGSEDPWLGEFDNFLDVEGDQRWP